MVFVRRITRVVLPVLFVALEMLGSSARPVEAADENVQKEIRQGGYVEKVDPNVDYKDRLPRIPPKEPAESMKTFHLLPGFRIDQVAAEPLVCDPVDLVIDENGRMFVAEMIPYAEGNTSTFGSPNGRVSMLEDTDGDGRYDKSTVYADKLVWPTGVTCFDGGIFVASAPDLWYFKDTDGDGKADVRELVLTGFETSNPNALPNSLRWGLDSRIHGMTSTAGGELKAVKWAAGEGRAARPIQSRGRDFSIDPRTGELRLESGGSQFGMTYDAWGAKFECNNSAPIQMVMYEERYIARNPYLVAPSPLLNIWTHGSAIYRTSPAEPWRVIRMEMRVAGKFSGPVEGGGNPVGYFTGACGLYMYLGHTWPEECYGDAFLCEGSGNLVHRMRLKPNGIAYAAYRVDQNKEFLTSNEIWFRPIQFTDGPDGNLYLADMYRELYEHPDAVPPSVKKYLDLTAGKDRGRIYRIAPEGFRYARPEPLGGKPTADLVALLAHPNAWHRRTASRLLYERQDPAAVAPLEKMALKSDSPLGRMHAMYALAGQGRLAPEIVLARLDDPHPRVRENALRLSEAFLAESPALREKVYAMVSDDDPRVRYQLAFTLGEIPGSPATAALARLAVRDGADRWVRLAVLSSSFGRAGELFGQLIAERSWRNSASGRILLEQVAEQAGLQNRSDQIAQVFKTLEEFTDEETALARVVVRGLTRGLDRSGSPLRSRLASDAGTTLARRLLEEMIAQAKARAGDEKRPVDERVEAVASLSVAPFEEIGELLGELLDSRQPKEVQVAALQALSRFRHEEVAGMILDAWQGFSPTVRGAAAETLFARPERILELLAAIEDQWISPSQLDPARIQFLLSHPNETIRREAVRLLGSAKLARREDVVAAYRDVLDRKGDPDRGREVFRRECAKCHRLEGVGYDLGLPLNTIQNRGPEAILLAVLDPNRDVQPQYLNYVVVTDDGLSITGMISAETATSLTLVRAENESDTVLRTKIDELQNTGLSIMPEGLEKQLTRQEMADVIAYLMSVK